MLVVAALPNWRSFIYCISTSSLTLRCPIGRFTLTRIYPFCTFSPAYRRLICNIFTWTFLLDLSFYSEQYGFERALYTLRCFLPCHPSSNFGTFMNQVRAGSSHLRLSFMPALIESPLSAGTWF